MEGGRGGNRERLVWSENSKFEDYVSMIHTNDISRVSKWENTITYLFNFHSDLLGDLRFGVCYRHTIDHVE